MKAMVLAAGRGERLRPLTDTTPKPLINIGKRRLIEYHLLKLADAGIHDVIINTAWLGDLIKSTLGDGSDYQLNIQYSDESPEALETAGGIIKALPLLGNEPFLVINGDIWTDYDISPLINKSLNSEAHLVLVDNPNHNPAGDFGLQDNKIINDADTMYTYSGIGLYTADLFRGLSIGKTPLAPILRSKCELDLISGELYKGYWSDVGTEQRLNELNNHLNRTT